MLQVKMRTCILITSNNRNANGRVSEWLSYQLTSAMLIKVGHYLLAPHESLRTQIHASAQLLSLSLREELKNAQIWIACARASCFAHTVTHTDNLTNTPPPKGKG